MADLSTRARRAYELGRLRLAFRAALPASPLIAVSLFGCDRPVLSAALGAVLLAALIAMRWRGGDSGRGARAGFFAGLAPMAAALAARAVHACSGPTCDLAIGACLAGGAVAGLAVGILAARVHGGSRFLVCAALISLLTGSLGCIAAGGAGLGGLALGFAVAAIPAAALAPRFAR